MKLFENESENRDYLFNKLKDNKEIAEKSCFVGKEIPVPYKHIYMPVRNSLEISCYKQDICIYQKLYDKTIGSDKITMNTGGKSILDVAIGKNSAKEKDVGMPFVFVETKMDNVKTEALFVASEKTKMIKSIFPYCKAFLLIFGNPHGRVFRHCLGFDEILFLQNLSDGNCDAVLKKIIDGFHIGYGCVPFIASHNYPYEPE
ncbi:MAG: hypothetical protein FWD26_09580 [Treponema sp.]|nr:hypothetical protein [Treponema sp.]